MWTTIVSGEKPAESKSTFDFDEYAKSFRDVKWTLYTRGDYAIATAANGNTDGPPATSSTPQTQPAPTAGSQVDVPLNIEFRQISGVWKIDRLLPAEAIPVRSWSQND